MRAPNSAYNMKRKLINLSRHYTAELGKHLKQGPRASMQLARRLGREAMASGLQTLDLARIHQQALATVVSPDHSPGIRNGQLQRAEIFFVEAITPIEKTHSAVIVTNVQLSQLNKTLRQRTVELAATNRRLKQEIVRRKAGDEALKKSQQHQSKLLQESRHMQEQLRRLSHQILLAQEEERKEISRELHDDIAQTLTGINVHLAGLTQEATVNAKGLKKKIARTKRLVEKSVNIVHRFARELRPTLLDDLGLIPALHSFMKGFTKRTGLNVRFTAFAGVEQLNSAKRTVLYRVAQAALTNVARHAQASRVNVSIRKVGHAIRMEISDDGKSFRVEQVLFAKRNKRLGLIGMRERVEMVGGSFSVESAPGKGTTIRAEIAFGNGNVGRRAELVQSGGRGDFPARLS
jgi:signal transduction histidine kinase